MINDKLTKADSMAAMFEVYAEMTNLQGATMEEARRAKTAFYAGADALLLMMMNHNTGSGRNLKWMAGIRDELRKHAEEAKP